MKTIIRLIPGLLLISVIAAVSVLINKWIGRWFNPENVTIAIILSIFISSFFRPGKIFSEGISFSHKKLLNWGIILLGFKLHTAVLTRSGSMIFLLIISYAAASLFISVILGKFFKLDRKTALLLGAGSSICGASAVAALAPCLNAEKEKSLIAVTVVNLLGAAGVLIYSFIAVNSDCLNEYKFGTWSGLTLHGVAHAVAAAFAMGKTAGEAGTVIKMARVLLIIPVSLLFMFLSGRRKDNGSNMKNVFPGYVFVFIAAAVLNSVITIPQPLLAVLSKLSSVFILFAMTGLGLSINVKTAAGEGSRALAAGSVLFAVLSVSGYYAVFSFL